MLNVLLMGSHFLSPWRPSDPEEPCAFGGSDTVGERSKQRSYAAETDFNNSIRFTEDSQCTAPSREVFDYYLDTSRYLCTNVPEQQQVGLRHEKNADKN